MENLNTKKENLERARKILKEKFVGINHQINQIIDRISFWYLYPDKVRRPVIINLWGPTGVGKTDLIRTLRDALDMNGSFAEFLMSSTEATSDNKELCEKISEEYTHLTQGKPGILVLDEFQRYRTKDKNGDAIRALPHQDIWQILSDGKVVKNVNKDIMDRCMDLFNWSPEEGFSLCDRRKKSSGELLEEILGENPSGNPPDMNNIPSDIQEKARALRKATSDEELLERKMMISHSFIRKVCSYFKFRDPANTPYYYESLYGSPYTIENLSSASVVFSRLHKMLGQYGIDTDGTVEGLLEGLAEFENSSAFQSTVSEHIGYTFDMTKLLIFVVGNLDEVYKESLYTDSPFVPADVYRKWCDRITIYNVKEALSKLFFPEQVARFGNTHIIYPTLGQSHYQELIHRGMLSLQEDMRDIGADILIDSSVEDFIYRNGVYPVQGVRPVFTSIQEIASGVTNLVQHTTDLGLCEVFHREGKLELYLKSEDKLIYSCPLEGDRDSVFHELKKDDKWLGIISVHELGHALLSYIKFNEVPLFCVIQHEGATTVGECEPIDTFDYQWSKVLCTMAGSVAVREIMGRQYLSGSRRDISEATKILTQMIRNSGYLHELRRKVGMFSFIPYKGFLSPMYSILGADGIDEENPIIRGDKESALINKALKKAQKELVPIIRGNWGVIYELSKILAKDLFLGSSTIKTYFENSKVETSPIITRPLKGGNRVTGD
jgi:cell division protease FtsH